MAITTRRFVQRRAAVPDTLLRHISLPVMSKGLIRYLSFSFHGDADEMGKLIDTGVLFGDCLRWISRFPGCHSRGSGLPIVRPVGRENRPHVPPMSQSHDFSPALKL